MRTEVDVSGNVETSGIVLFVVARIFRTLVKLKTECSQIHSTTDVTDYGFVIRVKRQSLRPLDYLWQLNPGLVVQGGCRLCAQNT